MGFWTFLDRNLAGMVFAAIMVACFVTDCGKKGCHAKVGPHEVGCSP